MSEKKDNDLIITRIFNAPRELVFKVWTDPKHITQWWGPKEFTAPHCKVDLQVGGEFRFCMKAPDGKEYWNKGSFREIKVPEKIIWTMYFSDKDGKLLQPTDYGLSSDFPSETVDIITFEVHEKNKTKLTIQRNHSPELAKKVGEIEGWNQSLDKFESALAHVSEDTADREIVVTRLVNAPQELVWDAMTNPKHVVNWWGPKGFSTTIHEMNVKPGGTWKHTMKGPDGKEYPNKSVFIEVKRPERIVYTHSGGTKGERGVNFESTWTFASKGNQTEVTIRMIFKTAEDRDHVIKTYNALEGGKQTLGRLDEFVSGLEVFTVTRTLDAPRELVFKVWTEAEHLKNWLTPKGFSVEYVKADIREGGKTHYCMTSAQGAKMWGKAIYQEIKKPERLSYVQYFSDENEGVARHPMSPTWPLEMLTTVLFEEEGKKTKITLTWTPINPSAEEKETFKKSRDGMNQGWSGTFELLTEYIQKIS